MAWLTQYGATQVHTCLEATGSYSDARARFLCRSEHHVSLVNPRQIKAFAQIRLSRNKTDAADAALNTRFCQTQQPSLWQPLAPEQEALQVLCRH